MPLPHRPHPLPPPARGLTLVETLIVLGIVAVLLGSVLPHFGKAAERRHLEGAAAQLATDIKLTRSLAVAHNRGLRLVFQNTAAGSCYVVHDGAAGDCQCASAGPAVCRNGVTAQRSNFFAASGPVQVQANVGSIVFHPVHGTSTPTGTLRLVARSGTAVHQVVNIMGRARACSPHALPGYPDC
jgi:type IV fimbrial biogenesis protein FimT